MVIYIRINLLIVALLLVLSQLVHGQEAISENTDPISAPQTNSNSSSSGGGDTISAQQTGGNFASFNESCSSGQICISSRRLICDGGICKCDKNPDSINIPLVYVSNYDVQECVPEAVLRNGWRCNWDQQCTQGKYGPYSRCSPSTRKCECYDPEGRNRKIVEYENTCFLTKAIGDACDDDIQCNVTIPGEAICLGARSNGICRCASGYVWEGENAFECLHLRTFNETCRHDLQCSHTDALRDLARCTNGKCECYDTKGPVIMPTGYYIPEPNPNNAAGKCYYVKGVNETCTTSEECILGYDKNAACLQHPSYNAETICQCKEGAKCDAAAISTAFAFIITCAFISKLF